MRTRRLHVLICTVFVCFGFAHDSRADESNANAFTVSDEAPTLCEIGILLYGRCSAHRKIALWNDLQPPFQLRLGQVLILKEPAALSLEEGRAKLLSIWRRKFGLPAFAAKSSYEAALETLSKPAEIGDVVLQLPPKEAQNETRIMAAEAELELAKELFEKKDYEGALASFHSLRSRQPKFLPPWIYEVRSLKALSREKDAGKTVSELLEANPELRPALQRMPLLAPYVGGSR